MLLSALLRNSKKMTKMICSYHRSSWVQYSLLGMDPTNKAYREDYRDPVSETYFSREMNTVSAPFHYRELEERECVTECYIIHVHSKSFSFDQDWKGHSAIGHCFNEDWKGHLFICFCLVQLIFREAHLGATMYNTIIYCRSERWVGMVMVLKKTGRR